MAKQRSKYEQHYLWLSEWLYIQSLSSFVRRLVLAKLCHAKDHLKSDLGQTQHTVKRRQLRCIPGNKNPAPDLEVVLLFLLLSDLSASWKVNFPPSKSVLSVFVSCSACGPEWMGVSPVPGSCSAWWPELHVVATSFLWRSYLRTFGAECLWWATSLWIAFPGILGDGVQ